MYKQIEIDGKQWNYLIYDDGRVYSLTTKKFLSPDTSSGYARYMLCDNKKHKRIGGHTLVGLHFIPNPKNLPIVNHIDGNTLNNNITNLEWISYSDNVKGENRKKHSKIIQTFSLDELKTEVWRPIKDGRYSVSNLGRLRNNDKNEILHGHINPKLLYIRDNLYLRNGTIVVEARHRMVWEAFYPGVLKCIINHKDGDKTNNRLSNLENITDSQNLLHAYHQIHTKKTRKCKGLNLQNHEIRYFKSIADAAKTLNCNESNIRAALNLHDRAGGGISHGWQWFNLTNEEYSQILKSSETTENIVREKDSNE